VSLPLPTVTRNPFAGAALDPPLSIVPNKALSLTHTSDKEAEDFDFVGRDNGLSTFFSRD
jgi:hypothetical protein